MKSFIIHYDSLDVLDAMSDEQAWKLFRKMKSFHNWNDYKSDDPLVDAVFIQFKNQFDRDLEKYESICERNRKNWKKWGRPRLTQENPNNPDGLSGNPKKPKKPYNKNKSNNKSKNSSNNKTDSKKENQLSTLSKDKEAKAYWNPDVNECLEIIKGLNGWIVDWTIKDQRRYAKHLVDKIKKLDKISSGERSWQDYLKWLLNLVSKSKYDVRKIVWPKQIFKNLAGLQQVANQMHTEMKNPKKTNLVSKIKL